MSASARSSERIRSCWVMPAGAVAPVLLARGQPARHIPSRPAHAARIAGSVRGRIRSSGLGRRRRLGEARRAGDAGTADAAVAPRVLGEVVLTRVFGGVELGRLLDLGGDLAVARLREDRLVGLLRGQGGAALGVAVVVDRRAVLGPDVVALAHALRRVVVLPEHAQQVLVRDLGRVEHHQHRLGVAGGAAADLLVGGVRGVAARVADRGGVHAGCLPELPLRAPEAAQAEDGALGAGREGRLEPGSVDEVGVGHGHPLPASRKRLLGGRHAALAQTEHGLGPSLSLEPTSGRAAGLLCYAPAMIDNGKTAMARGKSAWGWRWEQVLHGIVPPLISPLDEAGVPDGAAMAALVDHVVGAGCTGLFVLGGCGEGAWLTASQRGAVIRHAARAAAGRVPVLAGVMLPGTGAAVEAAHQAAEEGADALVVGSPYYFGVDAAAQERHIGQVLAAQPRPALLYHIPQC